MAPQQGFDRLHVALLVMTALMVGHLSGVYLAAGPGMTTGQTSDHIKANKELFESELDKYRRQAEQHLGEIEGLKKRANDHAAAAAAAVVAAGGKPAPSPPLPPPPPPPSPTTLSSQYLSDKVIIFGVSLNCILNKQAYKLSMSQDPCHEAQSKFLWIRKGDTLRDPAGLCLDIAGLPTNVEGTSPRLTPCKEGSATQQFKFVPDPMRPKFGYLKHEASGRCLENSNYKQMQYLRFSTCQEHCAFLFAIQPADQLPMKLELEPSFNALGKPANVPVGQRIMCMVLTYPRNHYKLPLVMKTWGKWCDGIFFATSEPYPDPNIHAVPFNLSRAESRGVIWEKTRMGWEYMYKHYINDYDWFCKFDDDTFVNVDNLREWLTTMDSNVPHYLGRSFTLFRRSPSETTYYSGGAGYIMSKEALKWLGSNASFALTGTKGVPEDLEMGKRMRSIGILTEDTRDAEGVERFIPLNIVQTRLLLKSTTPTFWYWTHSSHQPVKQLDECCAKKWVASHYNSPTLMQNLYYAKMNRCEAHGTYKTWSQRLYPRPEMKPSDIKAYFTSVKAQLEADAKTNPLVKRP